MTSLVSLTTPVNLKEEKDRFLSSKSYNPIFSYVWQADDNIFFDEPLKNSLWQAIVKQDHDLIVKFASKWFDVEFCNEILRSAERDAHIAKEKTTGSAEEYTQLLTDSLRHFQLEEIKVILTEQGGFNVRPDLEGKNIKVSKEMHFELMSMNGGVRHEMVHVIRYFNGKYNNITKSDGYLPTEEGLASWCQDNTKGDSGRSQHAIEYIASSVGLTGSLRDIFDCMCDLGMTNELAWKRASRHKFGFIDTSIGGDILKPAMYYANEMKIDTLARAERLRLFVGKIRLDELPIYEKYRGAWSDESIINYFDI